MPSLYYVSIVINFINAKNYILINCAISCVSSSMLFLRLVLRNAQNGHYGKYIVAKIISLVYYCHKCLNRHSELNPGNTSSKMTRTCTNIILKPKYQILSHCLDDGGTLPAPYHRLEPGGCYHLSPKQNSMLPLYDLHVIRMRSLLYTAD